MNKITIEIATDGSTTVSVNGVKGTSCQQLTKNLEKALGKTSKDTKTKEFYQNEQVKHLHHG